MSEEKDFDALAAKILAETYFRLQTALTLVLEVLDDLENRGSRNPYVEELASRLAECLSNYR